MWQANGQRGVQLRLSPESTYWRNKAAVCEVVLRDNARRLYALAMGVEIDTMRVGFPQTTILEKESDVIC